MMGAMAETRGSFSSEGEKRRLPQLPVFARKLLLVLAAGGSFSSCYNAYRESAPVAATAEAPAGAGEKNDMSREHKRTTLELLLGKHAAVPETAESADTENARAARTGSIEGRDGKLSPWVLHDLMASYPKGWITGEVEKIIQQPHLDPPIDPSYGLGPEWKCAAVCASGIGSEKADIIFYASAKQMSVSELAATLAHESGHASDPWRSARMSRDERIELLLTLTRRIEEADRYQSFYVESIKNPDAQERRFHRVLEYWAEICGAYFSNPAALPIADFAIVHQVVKRMDPGYDSFAQAKAREKAIARGTATGEKATRPAPEPAPALKGKIVGGGRLKKNTR